MKVWLSNNIIYIAVHKTKHLISAQSSNLNYKLDQSHFKLDQRIIFVNIMSWGHYKPTNVADAIDLLRENEWVNFLAGNISSIDKGKLLQQTISVIDEQKQKKQHLSRNRILTLFIDKNSFNFEQLTNYLNTLVSEVKIIKKSCARQDTY